MVNPIENKMFQYGVSITKKVSIYTDMLVSMVYNYDCKLLPSASTFDRIDPN